MAFRQSLTPFPIHSWISQLRNLYTPIAINPPRRSRTPCKRRIPKVRAERSHRGAFIAQPPAHSSGPRFPQAAALPPQAPVGTCQPGPCSNRAVADRLASLGTRNGTSAPVEMCCKSSSPEQLHDSGRQRGRIEQGPAFIENRDAWQSSLTRCARGHGVGDEHAHRSFESRVRAQTLHIEEEPVAIKPHGGLCVEQPGVDAFLTCPRS